MSDQSPPHDHAFCIHALSSFFKRTCTCGHALRFHELIPHPLSDDDDDAEIVFGACNECREGLVPDPCGAGVEGGHPCCGIEEEMPHVAEHALPGQVRDHFILYCDSCFVDVYGPHDCERLGCKENPCPDFGKLVADERDEGTL